MQKLQVQPPLADRLAELEKWHSRYEIDTILLQEGYNSADVDAAWQGKGYKEETPFAKVFWQTISSPRQMGKLVFRVALIFMCLLIPTLAIFGDITLFTKYIWYLTNSGNMNIYNRHRLSDDSLLPVLILIPLAISWFIITMVFFIRNRLSSMPYILLTIYHLLPFLAALWLFFKLIALSAQYPVPE